MSGAEDHRTESLPPRAARRALPRWSASDPGECPDAEAVAAFAEGRASAGERVTLERHLVDCESCRLAVIEVLREPAAAPHSISRAWIRPERRVALVCAAAVFFAALGGALWLAWRGASGGSGGGTGEREKTELALATRASDLAARYPEELGDLRCFGEAELLAAPYALLRTAETFALLHPRGLVLELRPEISIVRDAGEAALSAALSAKLTDEQGAPIATAPLAPPAQGERVVHLPWPFEAALEHGRSYLLHVGPAVGEEPDRARVAFRVAPEADARRFDRARGILDREATPSLRHGLLAHLALQRGYVGAAALAAAAWVAAAPEDPLAAATQLRVDRLLGIPRALRDP